MSSFVCIDLTAYRPAALLGDGTVEAIWPSFCLPWFPGEEPLVGEVARRHRRSSDPNAWEEEARLDLERRGRYHFAEGWLMMARHPDSSQPSNTVFSWSPTGEPRDRVEVAFTDVIRAVLRKWASPETALALIVPDGLGPGPRQEILDRIESDFERVQLVPRSIAIAVEWCRSPDAQSFAEGVRAGPGTRAGSLLVTTTPADTWEAAVVPIRLEGVDSLPTFCPIHERVRHGSETGNVGIEMCIPDGLSHGSLQPEEVWASWLDPRKTDFKFAERGTVAEAVSACFSKWSLPGALGGEWRPPSSTVEVELAVSSCLHDSVLVDWVHQGPKGALHLTECFDFLKQDRLPTPLGEQDELILEGGLEVMKLIADGKTPYYESLAQVDLYVQGRNEYQDPIEEWRPLIEATEVPVGRSYESPEPIRGLSLPPGRVPVIDLYLRSERRAGSELGFVRAEQKEPQVNAVPVKIEARLDPGRGLVRFAVDSDPPGRFHAEVRESALQLGASTPSIRHSWPPGSAWIIPHRESSTLAILEIERLLDRAAHGLIGVADFARVRESMNKWTVPSQFEMDVEVPSYPPYIHRQFVYLGVAPCADRASGRLDQCLRDYAALIEREFDRVDIGNNIWRDALLFAASWLYCYCPENILDALRRVLASGRTPRNSELACIGNCFASPPDYKLFFDALVSYARGHEEAGNTWVRAYRNIARFRADALRVESLSTSRQDLVLDWYLSQFGQHVRAPQGGSFGYIARLAPHILKRRRYDPTFLEVESESYRRFSELLNSALKKNLYRVHRADLEATREFLDNRADVNTLERLGRNK